MEVWKDTIKGIGNLLQIPEVWTILSNRNMYIKLGYIHIISCVAMYHHWRETCVCGVGGGGGVGGDDVCA